MSYWNKNESKNITSGVNAGECRSVFLIFSTSCLAVNKPWLQCYSEYIYLKTNVWIKNKIKIRQKLIVMPFTYKLQVLWALKLHVAEGGCPGKHWDSREWVINNQMILHNLPGVNLSHPDTGLLFPKYICEGTDLRLLCIYVGTVELRSQIVFSDLNSDSGKNSSIDKSIVQAVIW